MGSLPPFLMVAKMVSSRLPVDIFAGARYSGRLGPKRLKLMACLALETILARFSCGDLAVSWRAFGSPAAVEGFERRDGQGLGGRVRRL